MHKHKLVLFYTDKTIELLNNNSSMDKTDLEDILCSKIVRTYIISFIVPISVYIIQNILHNENPSNFVFNITIGHRS